MDRDRPVMDPTGAPTGRVVDKEFAGVGSFERYIDHVPAAFAVTRGHQHVVVYANAAFRNLVSPDGEPLLGRPIADAFVIRSTTGLIPVLDRVFRTGVVARDRLLEPMIERGLRLSGTVWPDVNSAGESEHLIIELRLATQRELTVAVQREVAERLLLGALQVQDAADIAEVSRQGAMFLASESRRLTESLDESATLAAMAGMSLPHMGGWCIVDTLDEQGVMHRLAIVHPDPAKQALLDTLAGRWVPEPNDAFGLPAALRNTDPTVVTEHVDDALGASAHDPEILQVLRSLGFGPLLTVPLITRDHLVGAVTFVGGRPFTPDDIELARDLASRSALALDRARLYGEAIALTAKAESANQAKSAFLGMMSHELRTPLNAIGGFVELMDMGIHGPVTDAQRADLARIRTNQRYLTGLISDLLNLTKLGTGKLVYRMTDFSIGEVLTASVALVEPLIAQKQLVYGGLSCEASILACGDPERVIQILVNLLSNAIKFTPSGKGITIECEATRSLVLVRISDTGIGIPGDKLVSIFEPFVQVKSGSAADGGIGLGLSISRNLARGMNGDLTVESTLGEGARFTLTLPRSHTATDAVGATAAPPGNPPGDGHENA